MERSWFEMRDEIRRKYTEAVWIPLKTSRSITQGTFGHLGYVDEFVGTESVAVDLNYRTQGDAIHWSDTLIDHGVYAYNDGYQPAEVFELRTGEPIGIHLALIQHFDGLRSRIWHVNQDLIFALNLVREEDSWVRPLDGYIEVIRLLKDKDGAEQSLEIRAEYLKDFLCARRLALRITSYRSRRAVLSDQTEYYWPKEGETTEIFDGRFEGRAYDIHEGGRPYGTTAAMFHVSRTDVDFQEDVPVMGQEDDENTQSKSWDTTSQAPKLRWVEGEFWRNEWLEPAPKSARVRGDRVASNVTFVTNAAGDQVSADLLNNEDIGRWLWFSPNVVDTILSKRGSSLQWYTRETGAVEILQGYRVHFGVNDEGLLTVYAYDVAKLPEWQRRLWAGFNITPEGRVSRELLMAQAKAMPASTEAPEYTLGENLKSLNISFQQRWGESLIRKHDSFQNILDTVHRFRAINQPGILGLAKDIARLTADSFDVQAMNRAIPAQKRENLGSLKSLERILAELVGKDDARKMLTPLVGVYDLRLGDAHLPQNEIKDALKLVEIDERDPLVFQGLTMIESTNSALYKIMLCINSG